MATMKSLAPNGAGDFFGWYGVAVEWRATMVLHRDDWASKMKILHTMIRVGDLDLSIDFYTRVLGMTLLRRQDYPAGKFTLAFVGYDDEAAGSVIELTHNWGVSSYTHGDSFGHIALAVNDAYQACEDVKNRGGKVVRAAGPMNAGSTVIAFVEDPDGYQIEFIQERS